MEPALCQGVKTIILFLERTRDFQISALSKVIFIYPAFPGFRNAAVRPAAAAPERPPGPPSTHKVRLAHAIF